ncbi:hypothetical protein N7495_005504 [Penicillium taxi]|uniref:uncharacterized protein n=1 Tax=Penicillium taxi TaxID=168475 RepID=UPI002544F1C0|nr:uncharacterized protein N7495_005504 [Penicillium taxi]KAJ5893813.1 hypothetical protein N7495_005504 [Penicillium taxi]
MTTKYELSDFDKGGLNKIVRVFILYELQSTSDVDQLISALKEGVRNATLQLPFMAGNFQFMESGKVNIVVSPESEVQVETRRLNSTELKSFSTLSKNSFSPDDLDFAKFLPEESTAAKPVCTLQFTLIDSGLVLGLRMNHAAGDWASMDRFLSLICQSSKSYQQGLEMPTFTPDLKREPYNTPSESTISRQEILEKLPIFYVMEKSDFRPKPQPPSRSCIYQITNSSVEKLKARCTPLLTEVDYITSYDCISALMWKSITRARLQLHPEKSATKSRFIHPIDVRTRDPEKKTSDRYFGNAVIGSQAGPLVAEALVSNEDKSLAVAATRIRQSITATDLWQISRMNSLVASLSPTEMLNYGADFGDMDIFMNSWYSGSAEKYDIGAASVPIAFRQAGAMPGACVVILPNFSRGPVNVFDVLVQLTGEEHESLGNDAEFLTYFEPAV